MRNFIRVTLAVLFLIIAMGLEQNSSFIHEGRTE